MKNYLSKKAIRISAIAMAIMVFCLSFANVTMSVYASETSTVGKGGSLYGTGSANELNIVKLLDMALNRGGISMSPATIKQFLEFWWSAVKSDLNTCIGNVDTSITGTQAFADALNAAFVDADHYDKLGDIIKKYISFCLTMDYKSLSDFKQLLTQEGTFRQFLLSYVADEDGNIVGTVDNKLKKYNLKSGLVNMVRKAADAYIEEYEGYYLYKTKSLSDISPVFFPHKAIYNDSLEILRSVDNNTILYLSYYTYSTKSYYFADVSDSYFVLTSNSVPSRNAVKIQAYNYDWMGFNLSVRTLQYNGSYELINDSFSSRNSISSFTYYPYRNLYSDNSAYAGWIFTSDGRSVKIWKSVEEMKKYSVGHSDIYYSNQYSGFDYEVDNSVTFDYDYYNSNNYSHTVIQNNIDNSTEVNETVINNIVNNYITNNYYGNGTGDNSENPGGGNWFTQLIGGIPELLKAIIDGLAGIVDSVAGLLETFIESITGLFEKIFVPSEESRNALKEKVDQKFSFVSISHGEITGLSERLETMGGTAPTITFPLSKTPLAEYGVEDIVVSFEWFEPYRYGFHTLLSSIMWIMFIFNQYFAIKNILQGTGSFAASLDEPEPEHHRAGFDLW